MQDTISDMLTRIRNGQMSNKDKVSMPASKIKIAILKVFKEEGYIGNYEVIDGTKPTLNVHLKYFADKPVIETLRRVSKPGLRIYKGKGELPRIMGGLGVAVISTSHGVMSDKAARKAGFGGEVLCFVA